ncbi:type II toxin-antitoxin system HipA family toxin [Amorphus sp. MBR-141]
MARRRTHPPLRVYMNARLVGHLLKEPSGAIAFRYDESWLAREQALPVSLSLPLRDDAYRGEPVAAVFENLLPDSDGLRRRVAERVGAAGIDAYSMLARIGHDCVGALQFIPGDDEIRRADGITGDVVDDLEIEALLANLAQAPLGLGRDDDFRISVAGAQEKTALLRHDGRWLKPHGTTPTTHILKPPIGTLPNGIDLSNSVENEFYCLKLAQAFGLPAAEARIARFGNAKALVVERFDRMTGRSGTLLRLPQEDCCQALSVPPTRKYQSEGGPGMGAILDLLKGSDIPAEDRRTFLLAQIFFWIIGATDGHAKNFSIFLEPGGGFRLTPVYDVLTAQPSLDARQIRRSQMRLAMCAGNSRHYRIDRIHPRHFAETAAAAGMPAGLVRDTLVHVLDTGARAFERIEAELPGDFPAAIHASVKAAALPRVAACEAAL